MTEKQKTVLKTFLTSNHADIQECHHGDCVGADADFHTICEELNIPIYIHPPANPANRAFCRSPHIFPEFEYLVRNCHIVDSCDVLLAAPKSLSEERRSGTWHAIRYALGKKPVNVFYYDGSSIFGLSKV